MPVFGFFFSRRGLAAQPVSGTHAVELTDADREMKTLSKAALHVRTGGRTVVLAIVQHPCQHLSSKLRGVSMSPLGQGVLAFTLGATRAADTRSCDASEWGRASVRLRRVFPAPPAGQSPAWLPGAVLGLRWLA